MASPIESVLNSSELLTTILTYPPLKTSSPVPSESTAPSTPSSTPLKLQQHLFLTPITNTATTTPILNPLFTTLNSNSNKPFEPWFKVVGKRITDTLQYSSDLSFSITGRSPTQQSALMCKDASWRSMLPIQPPPTLLEIVKMHPSGLLRKPGQPRGEVARVSFEQGVRMGVLYDLGWGTVSMAYAKWACLWNMFPFDKESMAPRAEVGDDWEIRYTRHSNMRLAQRREQACLISNSITFLMDLSMPLDNMINFMKPQHKSEGYESMEKEMEIEWKDVGVEELTHLAQMCAGECKLH